MSEDKAKRVVARDIVFSEDRRHRYTLFRHVEEPLLRTPGRFCQFIGLNPSTADEVLDDPTIRRCKAFSRSFGFQEFCMTNLFGWRSTDPKVLKIVADPEGCDNTEWIVECAKQAGLVIAAWGCHGALNDRDEIVLGALLENGISVFALKVTKDGHPQHPLYLKGSLKPVLFQPAEAPAL